MTTTLKLARDLSLPLETVTQTIAVLAKRRAGKSYTMRRLAEQLFKAAQQIVIVDPKGDQWGIRSAADGKSPGLPIVILGGERGDVPLESNSGEIVAKLVVEDRVSVLLDLSLFRKHEVATFMTAFLENLYRLKAREIYRTPVMLVIDEADAVAPQKPQKGEERMLGAAEDIVRRGGQRGIGCVLVTQRSAVLNKNVLTQAQVLIVLRTIAPQDLAAMDAWIDVHGEADQRKTLMESLPSLPIGDAWFWSPGWPTTDGIFKRVHVLPIETFDSGASPKPGVKPVEPKQLADVDLDALKGQMAATIAKAKADDPKELRKQLAAQATTIKQLEAQVAKAPAARTETRVVEKFVFRPGEVERLEKAANRFVDQTDAAAADRASALERVHNVISGVLAIANPAVVAPPRPVVASNRPVRALERPIAASKPRSDASPEPSTLTKAERKVLTALAQYPDGRTKTQVALLTVYASTGGGFNNALSSLRSAGRISGSDRLQITDAGIEALGPYDPLPMGRELLQYWLRQLSKAERSVLEVLADAYPESLTKEAVAAATNYEPSGGGFNNALSRLRTLELIAGRGDLRASEDLFE